MKRIQLFAVLALSLIYGACTKDTGTVKVTYSEATAVYGDLDEIRNQSINTAVSEIDNPGKVYVSEDIILVGEESKGIHVIDNTIPTQPVHINFISIPGNREYFVKENIIYAESYYDVVKLDFTNPSDVLLLDRANFVFSEEFKNDVGQTLLGFTFETVTKEVDQSTDLYSEIQRESVVYYDFARSIIPQSAVPASFAGNSNSGIGTVNRISHAHDHVYIVGRDDLFVIADEGNFEVVKQMQNVGIEMETVYPFEDKLFVGSRSSVDIYDVSDADNPSYDYRFDHATSCDPVLPVNDAAYISLRTADFSPCPGNTNALIVLDISDLDRPTQVAEIEMESPYGMSMIGNLLYVGEGENGLTVFDATDQHNLVQTMHNPDVLAYDIIAHPSRTDLILIAGPDGLEQYVVDTELTLQLESRIDF